MKEIKDVMKHTNENNVEQVNWTKVWSKKYPVLEKYQKEVDIKKYSSQIRHLLDDLKDEYGFNELDAMLILKDILYHEWKDKK